MQNSQDTIESRRCRLRNQEIQIRTRYYRIPETRSLGGEPTILDCLDKEADDCKNAGCKFCGGTIEPFDVRYL